MPGVWGRRPQEVTALGQVLGCYQLFPLRMPTIESFHEVIDDLILAPLDDILHGAVGALSWPGALI